jgi:hypothetical protein
MYNVLCDLRLRYELPRELLLDLIELVAYCQIDSVRANGIEAIFSEQPAYISPIDFIDEDIRIAFSSLYPKHRYQILKEAAIQAWKELPHEEVYWEHVNDLPNPQFNVRWYGSDLILEVS